LIWNQYIIDEPIGIQATRRKFLMPIYMTLPVNLHEAKGDAKRRV
jgi:hypothetical protein